MNPSLPNIVLQLNCATASIVHRGILKGIHVKGTVSVISSGLPFIEGRVRFTMIPFKPLFVKGFRRCSCLYSGKLSVKKPRECALVRTVHCTYTVTSSLPVWHYIMVSVKKISLCAVTALIFLNVNDKKDQRDLCSESI